MASSGYQEAMILVKGGCAPDVIVVQHGKPVHLNFRREEMAACSEMVLLPDFDKRARLPTGDVVSLAFLPEAPGEHEFACQMGMFRGKLVVEQTQEIHLHGTFRVRENCRFPNASIGFGATSPGSVNVEHTAQMPISGATIRMRRQQDMYLQTQSMEMENIHDEQASTRDHCGYGCSGFLGSTGCNTRTTSKSVTP